MGQGGPQQTRRIHILGIVGSPRRGGNTDIMVEAALKAAEQVEEVETSKYAFHGKTIAGCKATCIRYCQEHPDCAIADDFQSFMAAWLKADGVLFGVPAYHLGPPAQIKAAVDRLGNVLFAYLRGKMPRLNKACGAIVQGSSRWGGQEIVVQFLISHFMLMNCIPVVGDKPRCYMGAIGYADTWEKDAVLRDPDGLEAASNIGLRVAETARILRCGMDVLGGELTSIYSYEKLLSEAEVADRPAVLDWKRRV